MTSTADTLPADQVPGEDAPAAPAPRRSRLVVLLATVLALGVIGVVVAVILSGDEVRQGETREIVIPEGTADRLRKGEQISLLPPVLELGVGDRLIIRNQDVAIHYAGPYTVRPGETFDVTYRRPGIYPGPCTVNPKGETSIVVS